MNDNGSNVNVFPQQMREIKKNPRNIHPEYSSIHHKAKELVHFAGDGFKHFQLYHKGLINPSNLPEHIFDAKKTYNSIDDIEASLFQLYQTIAPSNQLPSTIHQHELSRIVTGDGIIEFLVYGAGFKLADTYLDCLNDRINENTDNQNKNRFNLWPLSQFDIQKRIKTTKSIKNFKVSFEDYQNNRNPQNLIQLFKQNPRLVRGYSALVAFELNKDFDHSIEPVYRYGIETLKSQIIIQEKRILKILEQKTYPINWTEYQLENSQALQLNSETYPKLLKISQDKSVRAELKSQYLKQLAHVEVTRNLFQERFVALAINEAKKWYEMIDKPDANFAAIYGLNRAIKRFDYDRGFRFSTFANWWIKQGLQRTYDGQGVVKIPVYIQEKIRRVRFAEKMLNHQGLKKITNEKIAESLGWDLNQVEKVRSYQRSRKIISINAPLNEGQGESDFGDFIEDPKSLEPINEIEYNDQVRAIDDLFKQATSKRINPLTEREEFVIKMRYGIGQVDGKTMSLQEIGDKYQISREMARQVELKGLRKLRYLCEKEHKLKFDLKSTIY